MRSIRLPLALILSSVATTARAAEPVPNAPAAPWKAHRLVVPQMTCTVELPADWESGRPMPDHILELWIRRDGGLPLAALIVEEGDPAKDLAAAASQFEQRVKRSQGDPQLRASQTPLEGAMRGVLVTLEAPAPKAANEQLQGAVFLVDGMTVQAMPSAAALTRGQQLKRVLASLTCRRKSP